METVAGIFRSRADAEQAVKQLHSSGFRNDRIALLTHDNNNEQIEDEVLVSDTEQPGMGQAMGGAVGGAMGAAGGATLGAAAASLLVPGVGPVIAGTILGAAILGLGGAAAGVAAGEAMEESLVEGLPRDEVYVYEDALNRGRSVVIAFAETEEAEEPARNVMKAAGAETVDAAREDWWVGLRDAEEEHYTANGGRFETDEVNYRRGFESALAEGGNSGTSDSEGEAYQRGYARGQEYQKTVRERYRR
ncbi:MAG TPA: general stress protein [Pyrinomonadaceae bacterium]|nr:general stress protein [Pyrinomonadaceae bacterium]